MTTYPEDLDTPMDTPEFLALAYRAEINHELGKQVTEAVEEVTRAVETLIAEWIESGAVQQFMPATYEIGVNDVERALDAMAQAIKRREYRRPDRRKPLTEGV